MPESLPSGLIVLLLRLKTCEVPFGPVYVNDMAGPVVSPCSLLCAST